jgi:hypothetical protein
MSLNALLNVCYLGVAGCLRASRYFLNSGEDAKALLDGHAPLWRFALRFAEGEQLQLNDRKVRPGVANAG